MSHLREKDVETVDGWLLTLAEGRFCPGGVAGRLYLVTVNKPHAQGDAVVSAAGEETGTNKGPDGQGYSRGT